MRSLSACAAGALEYVDPVSGLMASCAGSHHTFWHEALEGGRPALATSARREASRRSPLFLAYLRLARRERSAELRDFLSRVLRDVWPVRWTTLDPRTGCERVPGRGPAWTLDPFVPVLTCRTGPRRRPFAGSGAPLHSRRKMHSRSAPQSVCACSTECPSTAKLVRRLLNWSLLSTIPKTNPWKRTAVRFDRHIACGSFATTADHAEEGTEERTESMTGFPSQVLVFTRPPAILVAAIAVGSLQRPFRLALRPRR